MGLMRRALLAASRSQWLRDHATEYGFVRRSVSRFMPGESAQAALDASKVLQATGVSSILTYLGENVADAVEADRVTQHYLDLLDEIDGRELDTHISVKPTQLGLDIEFATCLDNLIRIVERAEALGTFVWIDMESSPYVDRTLALFRRLRTRFTRVGVCLQAYLRRTGDDLDELLALGPAVRLVKGAYREPAELAFGRMREVDERFMALAERLLTGQARANGAYLGIATHDRRLVRRLREFIAANAVPIGTFEFEMLYGIQRRQQASLVEAGCPLRVLVSYGEAWFPWFMRRLAERPANVLFVLRNLAG